MSAWLALATTLPAADAQPAETGQSARAEIAAAYGPGFTIRVVDNMGKPVAGALAGLNVLKNENGWLFGCNEVLKGTDADGKVELSKGARLLDRVCLVAIHERRGLAGVKFPNDKSGERVEGPPYEVVIGPACRVVGGAVISRLEHEGESPGTFYGAATVNNYDPFQWTSETGEFELLLPPGVYELYASGVYGHEIHRPLVVEAKSETRRLEPIDLPPTALGLLRGQPAPELRGIKAWKGSAGLTLAELRGRYVLLHFWGHWCGPCIAGMPELFAARDRFSADKLAIVGMHVGIEGEDEVDTPEELDTALAGIRNEKWHDRDLPFPEALLKAEKIPHVGGERDARSRAAADFGVVHYPTTILIDPQGRIVDLANTFLRSESGLAKLAKMIDSPAQPQTKNKIEFPGALTAPALPTP